MAACQLTIDFDEPERPAMAGSEVSGTVTVQTTESVNCKGLEVTCYWTTHGHGNVDKGDVDRRVLFEGTWEANQTYRYPFKLKTADWPPTYYGTYLNVSHLVRAQANVPWSIDPKTDAEFELIATKAPEDLKPTVAPAKARSILGAILGTVIGGALLLLVAVMFLPLLVIILPILLVGSGGVWFFRVFLPGRITGSIECALDAQRLTAGDTVRGKLRFTPKRGGNINGIRATIVCVEKCVSGSGSNRKTHQHELFRESQQLSEARSLRAGIVESFEFAMALPPDAPPSIKFQDNELLWNVELRIDIPRWPDWVKSFPLSVVPPAEPISRAITDTSTSESESELTTSTVESARFGSAGDDAWFDEVVQQITQSRHDPTRMEMVLSAVRDHEFSIRVDIAQQLLQPPRDYQGEPGTWMLAHYRARDRAMCLLFPPREPPPQTNTYDWRGRAMLLGYDPTLDRLIMRALPARSS